MIKVYEKGVYKTIGQGATFATGIKNVGASVGPSTFEVFAMWYDGVKSKIETVTVCKITTDNVNDIMNIRRGRLTDHSEAFVDMTTESWIKLQVHLVTKFFYEELDKDEKAENEASPKKKTKDELRFGFKKGEIVQLKPGVISKFPGMIEGKVAAFFEKPAGNTPSQPMIGVAFSEEKVLDAAGNPIKDKNKHLQWCNPNDLDRVSAVATTSAPVAKGSDKYEKAEESARLRSVAMIATLKKGAEKCLHFSKKIEEGDSYEDEYEADELF